MSRLAEIQKQIDEADYAYYTLGEALIEDALYDKIRDELKSLNPSDPRLTRVGASSRDAILSKRKHGIPMGSQEKAKNKTEFEDWLRNTIKDPAAIYHASYKMDGGSVSFEYKDGNMIFAVTRGDGLIGDDITANAHKFKNLPQTNVKIKGKLFTGFVRGEIILDAEDWAVVDPDHTSNPRNLAVGISRRKDGEDSDLIQVFAFGIFDTDGHPLGQTEVEQSQFLEKKAKFTVAPYMTGIATEVWSWYEKTATLRSSLSFWIDGLVVKLDSVEKQLSLGSSGNRPKGQIAIKFEAEGAVSTLRKVNLTVGYTGCVCPVAEFDPVQVGGTTLENANLCNWNNIRRLDIAVGDKMFVIKAGDIIPRIMSVTEKGKTRIEIPEPCACPVCAGTLSRKENIDGEESAAIYCFNPQCPAKVPGYIDKFLTSLDILGLGEKGIPSLVKELNLKDTSEIFALHQRQAELADIKLSGKTRFGEKRAGKFLASIESRKKLTLPEFLGALGIFGLGKRRVILVQTAMPGEFDTLTDWQNGKLAKYASNIGLPNTGARIQADIIAIKPRIDGFLANGLQLVKPEPKPLARAGAFVICITGELSQPKSHFWKLITESGNIPAEDYSKAVTHLVAADPNGSSKKLEKARKSGVPVLSENELINLLNNKEL